MSNDPNIPFEATTVYHNSTTFYFGSNFNLNGEPRVDVARALIRVLEDLTGWRCTSRWPWSPHHGGQTFGSTRGSKGLTGPTDLRGAGEGSHFPPNCTTPPLPLPLRGLPPRVQRRGTPRPQEPRGGPLKCTSKRRSPSEPQIRPISAKDAPSVVED